MGRKHRRKKVTPPPPEPVVTETRKWRFFRALCAFFFVTALVTGLSIITAWPGAESYLLERFADYLPAGTGVSDNGFLRAPRLISVMCLLLTGVVTYFLARPLFGRRATELGLLCAGASLTLPFLGKVATGDALGLLGCAGFFFAALLYAFSDRKYLLGPALGALGIGAMALPWGAAWLGVVVGGSAVAGWLGTDKKLLGVAVILPLAPLFLLEGRSDFSYAGADAGSMLLYGLLGLAPVSGWAIAGLRDLWFRVRRNDQLGRIYLLGLVGGVLTPLFPLLLAFLAGKQMQLYFAGQRYPWKDFVRSGQVLHLITAFGLVIVALIGGGIAFPGAGFRAALGMAGAYWIFSLLGTIGAFGDRRDFAIGGALFAGYLSVLFFWVQVYPYVEAQRNWPSRLIERMEPADREKGLFVPDEYDLSPALPYLKRAGIPYAEPGSGTLPAAGKLFSVPSGDSMTVVPVNRVEGRVLLELRTFGVER